MHITKTDYLEYTFCKKNLWLKKHKPELFAGIELSEFEKKIISEGNDADEAARVLFPGGELVGVVGTNSVPITELLMKNGVKTIFQAGFLFGDFFVQADILNWNDELSGWELFEVKATNNVKRTVPYHHVNDLAFQKNVLEGAGLKVVKAGVVHLNGEYRRHGETNLHELFIKEDLTDEVAEAQAGVREEMGQIKTYLEMPEEKGCQCLYRGRNAQCSTFVYSNPEVPEYSVHDIARIGASKKLLYDWIDRGIYAIEDIDNPNKLSGSKGAQYSAYMAGKPIIDHTAIKEELDALKFPLQFFDYEGYTSAIPRFDGFGAYEQTPFQYSLHIMYEDGTVEHREFLITEPEGDLTKALVERMRADFDENGTVISWYKSYESQRNKKLAELHPEHALFLEAMNDGMFDLMTIFSKNYYVDSKFKGSASIKKVLPVLAPELSYKTLNIQKGDQAVERWEKMIAQDTPQAEKEEIATNLLTYCKMDTWAMVRIYQVLREL